jgi:glycosyltransferase involved in cell wall biosynthesis
MSQISIIIPTYNAAKTITETIASVQKQTIDDWELIVVNDGSTDDTLKVLNRIEDSRLTILSVDNGGVAEARNLGLSRATGEYIAFLDADDLWVADKLELQLQALKENPQAIVAYSWTCFMDEQKSGYVYHASSSYKYQGNVYPRLLIADFIHSGSNTLIRKQALDSVGGFDSDCNGCEDWDLWLRLAAVGDFTVVPKHQIIYRRAMGSTTSNVEKMYTQALFAVNKAYQNAPKHLQHLRRRSEGNLHMYTASLYLQHGTDRSQTKKAGQHIGRSLQKYYPMLGNTFMQKLIIKFWLRYLLPGKLGREIFEKLRTAIAIGNPRNSLSK